VSEQTNKRLVLLTIMGIPVIVILAATWLWYFVAHGDLDLVGALGTANHGTLVRPPRQIDDAAMLDEQGLPFQYRELEPRWTMLVPAARGICNRSCEHNLYITRQIHVAMGKHYRRLQRMYVSDTPVAETALAVSELSDGSPAPADLATLIGTEHRELKALRLDAVDYELLFPEQLAEESTWYLVDPAGWIMMSYDSSVSYKDVMSDLKFLLTNSSE